MRTSKLCLLVAFALCATATPAPAHVAHTVEPGETLWSIAAASNLTTRTLAAANGLPEDAQVVLGSTIQIPSEQEGAAALAASGQIGAPASAMAAPQSQAAAPHPAGAYTVQPGDTLAGIAAQSGIGVSQLAWMNGLDPAGVLLAGIALKLPTGAAPAEQQEQAPAVHAQPTVIPDAEPNATPGQVTAGQIGAVASSHGVSPSLASAVAWQESGFQNGVISSANARGVMQILPGTWDWIVQQSGVQLDPNSATDNVQAGVMYLGQLLRDSGGDEATAVASYYQGAASVRRIGLLPETQRYVANVMALRPRFGG